MSSPISQLIEQFKQHENAIVLSRQIDTGVYVDTQLCNFEDYKKGLSVNARRAIFGNREKLLEEYPNIKCEDIDIDNIQFLFDALNELHINRWGKAFFTGDVIDFNQKMLLRVLSTKDSAKLMFSALKHGDSILSVQYNVEVSRQVVNLQSGFNAHFDSKMALGLIHFGMTLEDIFAQSATKFDFLVGDGKNANYKSKFSSLN